MAAYQRSEWPQLGNSPDGFAYAQLHQIAGAQLAVDAKIEQRQLPRAVLHLQAHANRPDLLEFEGRLLTDELTLIPGLVMRRSIDLFHDGLLAQKITASHSPPTIRSIRG